MSNLRIFKKLFLITTFIFVITLLTLLLASKPVKAESSSTSVTISAQVYACELIVKLNKGLGVNNLSLQTTYLLSIKERETGHIFSLVGETDQEGLSFHDLCTNQIYMMNSKVDIYLEAFNGLRKQIPNIEVFKYARSTLNVTINSEDFTILPNTIMSSVMSTSSGIPLSLPNMDAYLNLFESYSGFVSKLILLASIAVGVSYGSIYISKVFKSLLKEYIYAVKYIYRYITLGHIRHVFS